MILLDWLADAVGGIVGFLSDHLPHSPFADLSFDGSAVGNALGWLNWLVPFQQILVMLGVWLAAILAWWAVRFVMKNVVGKVFNKVA